MSNRSFPGKLVVLAMVGLLVLGSCRLRSRSQPAVQGAPTARDAASPSAQSAGPVQVELDAGALLGSQASQSFTPPLLKSLPSPPELLSISGFILDEPEEVLPNTLGASLEQLRMAMVQRGRGALVHALEGLVAARWGASEGALLLASHMELSRGWGVQLRSPVAFGVRRAGEALWGPSSDLDVTLTTRNTAALTREGPAALLMQWRRPPDEQDETSTSTEYLAVGLWGEASNHTRRIAPQGVARAGAHGAVVALAAEPMFDAVAAADVAFDVLEHGVVELAAQRGLREAQRRGRAQGLVAVLSEDRAAIRASRAGEWAASERLASTLDAALVYGFTARPPAPELGQKLESRGEASVLETSPAKGREPAETFLQRNSTAAPPTAGPPGAAPPTAGPLPAVPPSALPTAGPLPAAPRSAPPTAGPLPAAPRSAPPAAAPPTAPRSTAVPPPSRPAPTTTGQP